MKDNVRYSCTALAGSNKMGVLTPDDNGYYEMVLGAYDFPNSVGSVYPYESAKALFAQGSSLMRRIKNGQCRGECGHPKKQPGMTQSQYLERILQIEETNVCAHFKEVWIDTQNVKNEHGKNVVAVVGKVKPSGPQGQFLKEAFENADENVAFSVRSLTQDEIQRGTRIKHMKVLVTWDYVNEPGISVATKYTSPALEDFEENLDIVPAMLDVIDRKHEEADYAMEGGLTTSLVRSDLGWQKVQNLGIPSVKW